MNDYHSLLNRQLRRLLGDNPPPGDWENLLTQINDAYHQFDRDRSMIERSMEISSQELQQANADIRAVLEGLIDYYLRLDETGTILYARGLEAPAILRKNTSPTGKNIRDVIVPEFQALTNDMLTRMRIENTLNVLECCIESEQKAYHYEIRCIPAHNHQISVIIRDITDAKNAAEREQQLQHRLSRAERIESLGILAGGVAHDLNNTLSPLVSYPDLLMESFAQDAPQYDMLRQMQKSVIRATAIIQDLLTLTRRGNNRTEPVDVNLAFNHYLNSADFSELKKKYPAIHIETHIDNDLPLLAGSAHQLSQTIMNLVTNGCESIGEGKEGTITVSASHLSKSANGALSEETDSYVIIEIKDTGCGIPQGEIDHIFEPFFSRRKQDQGGTGLGLSIVYGTIKDFGGTIKVDSKIDQGTCFSIRLPTSPGIAVPTDKEELVNTNMSPCTVLVVDDDASQRDLCKAILSSRNYTVSTASNGREAVALLKLNDVDIVLLDMIMEEDCDGLRTYETIRTFKPQQKCIIVSGYAETDNVQKALSLGVHSFVQKPYTLKTLQSAIHAALESDVTHSN